MRTHSRTDDPATQGFPASCKPRPASLVQLLSFAFAYQFEQVRGLEDFDPEFPRRTEVPFVEGYHIGAQFAATSVISRNGVRECGETRWIAVVPGHSIA